MPRASLGKIVRQARERKDLSRAQIAVRLKITPAYLGHIENDSHVYVSPRVMRGLRRIFGRAVAGINEDMLRRHHAFVLRWNRDNNKAKMKRAS